MFGNIVAEVMNMNELDDLLEDMDTEQLVSVLSFVIALKNGRIVCSPEQSEVLPETDH